MERVTDRVIVIEQFNVRAMLKMIMQDAAIIHHRLLYNKDNGVSCAFLEQIKAMRVTLLLYLAADIIHIGNWQPACYMNQYTAESFSSMTKRYSCDNERIYVRNGQFILWGQHI